MASSLGGNILDKMRDSLDDIDFSKKNKGEIKQIINDWDNERIIKEILIQSGYKRNSITSLTEREQLLQAYANVTHVKRRKEEHHHKSTLHKIRSDIYREKLKEEGYNPDKIIQNSVDDLDVEEEICQELKETAVELEYEKEQQEDE